MSIGVTATKYQEAGTPWAFPCLRPAVEALLPPWKPKTRVLDIGCGSGFWANWLAQKGYEVVGVDPSESGIQLARNAYPKVRFEQMVADDRLCEQMGVEPFDLVISLEVVEHVYSPRQWASACFHALKPGGRMICSTPYHGYLKNLAISLMNKWDWHWSPNTEGGHIKFYSRKTLTHLLIEAAFSPASIRFHGAGRARWLWASMVMAADKAS